MAFERSGKVQPSPAESLVGVSGEAADVLAGHLASDGAILPLPPALAIELAEPPVILATLGLPAPLAPVLFKRDDNAYLFHGTCFSPRAS